MRVARAQCSILLLLLSACGTLVAPALYAQDDTPGPSGDAQQEAYRTSVGQESIRQQTDQIQAELSKLSSELQLNGLDSADLAILNNAAGNLKSLSAGEMQKVVNALQSASLATGDRDRQSSMVTAYKGQQSISLQLKSLASAIAAEQEQREIPSRIESLIARQSANLRQTTTLGSATLDQLSAAQKNTHEVVTSEQQAIAGEIDLLQKIVSVKPAAAPVDPTQADDNPAPDVLKALGNGTLQTIAAQAAQATSAGPFPDAVAQQTAVRDQLTSLLRVAFSKVDVATRLQQARELLDQILNDQNGLGSVEQEGQLDGATLAERQAGLEDRTAVANALLKPINQAVSTQLDQTQQDMGDASTTLASAHKLSDAAPRQQAVVADLTKAETLLDQQIVAAQNQESLSPTDKLAALQQLKAAIDGAQKNPQTSAADLQKLGQQAGPLSPSAANQIDNAADDAAKPQPDTNAISQALTQASADVQKQEDELADAAKQYQALADASNALAQAQQDSQDANKSIQSSPGNLTTAAHDLSQAGNAVSQAQQAVQQGSQSTQKQQGGSQTGQQSSQQQGSQSSPSQSSSSQSSSSQSGQSQDAGQAGQQQGGGSAGAQAQAGGSGAQGALQQAADALKDATNQAVQGQGAQAGADNDQALAAIQRAQAQLKVAMAQLAQSANSLDGTGQGGASPGQKPTQGGLDTGSGGSRGIGSMAGGAGVYSGPGQVVGSLKAKDRAAITQYQAEKSPPDYAPQIQQYLKNLADAAASGTH